MTTLIGVCLGVLLCSQIAGCVCLSNESKKRKMKLARMQDDRLYYDKCLAVFVLYRKIRHDFANYAQGAQMVLGEEGRAVLKQQKENVRQLIFQWSDEKEKLMQMSDKQIWDMES